ncbi:hypothetical protein LOK49_LG14G02138 [Camellia lanceoleosa]|uniref:Uncharacterized protein n=1 Tax=Camellia lanceoleosa TaxID=1840588 RepID=A0ACC0F972_9ERIC|nr:hypothetical protein LOK49_LG14G02138 [Camellia lanceoleosa]
MRLQGMGFMDCTHCTMSTYLAIFLQLEAI